jgi:hypothetical protein
MFENLGEHDYDHNDVSPPVPRYNCIAWAAGENHRRWWPADWDSITYYWPPHLQREPFGEQTLENFIAAFQSLGYKKCWFPFRQKGIEKVAIYGTSKNVPTHAVRQLESGEWVWASKCGIIYEDIKHRKLFNVSGREYGKVIAILKRRRDGNLFLIDKIKMWIQKKFRA